MLARRGYSINNSNSSGGLFNQSQAGLGTETGLFNQAAAWGLGGGLGTGLLEVDYSINNCNKELGSLNLFNNAATTGGLGAVTDGLKTL